MDTDFSRLLEADHSLFLLPKVPGLIAESRKDGPTLDFSSVEVVSTSEVHEYWWNDIVFIFYSSVFCRYLEASKIKHDKF